MLADAMKRPAGFMAELDESLVWSAILLLAIGLVMVYSASIATAAASRASPTATPRRRWSRTGAPKPPSQRCAKAATTTTRCGTT